MSNLSPTQQALFELKKNAASLKLAADLIEIHKKFINKLDEVNDTINNKIGPRGYKGEPGAQGPAGKDGKSIPGPAGKDGLHGTSVNFEEVIKAVLGKITIPKNGENGKDAFITEKHIEKIATIAARKVKIPEIKQIDAMSVIEEIQKMPAGKRISSAHIDGLEQTLSAFRSQLSRGYLHGGGDTVVAGNNITITKNANGTKTISSTGAGGSNFQIPASGLVNGTNKTFTWTANPNIIHVDDTDLIQNEQGGTQNWTLSGSGPYTTVLKVAPTQNIFSPC